MYLHADSERKQEANFLLAGLQEITSHKGTNLSLFDQSRREDLFFRRYNFWKDIMRSRPKTKEEEQSKRIVEIAVFNARILPITVFVVAGTALMKVTGILKLQANAKLFGAGMSIFFAYFWTNYQMSTKIFNNLPALPDASLEKQRRQLLSESMILDGTLANIYEISQTDK